MIAFNYESRVDAGKNFHEIEITPAALKQCRRHLSPASQAVHDQFQTRPGVRRDLFQVAGSHALVAIEFDEATGAYITALIFLPTGTDTTTNED